MKLTRQVGLSLIELMISMALASVIAAAAITMLVSDSQTSRFQIGQVSAHTSGRFAFDFVLADLRRAGYSENALVTRAVTGSNSDVFATGDVLNVIYDSALVDDTDCIGNPIVAPNPADRQVTNTYGIQMVDGQRALTCNGSVLMHNIESFHVLFGIDSNGDGELDRYVKPGTESAADEVLAVQISMLVATQEAAGENLSREYTVLDATPQTYDDGRARIQFTATERIRNINMDAVL